MTDNVNCEGYEKQPATDSEYESDSLESSMHSLSIRVEYYRSFEYCLKLKTPMSPRRSPRRSKASKTREEVIQRSLKGKTRKKGLRKTEACNSVDTDERRGRDIIDFINSTYDAKGVSEEDEGTCVEVDDEGLDESDEDCGSVKSIASGPSILHVNSPKKPRTLQVLCKTCMTLSKKARRMKAPVKNKILDIDPKSLTCDQWVLIKKWSPRRLQNTKGNILFHVKRVKKRLMDLNGARGPARCVGEGQPSACSRQHPFLQRNLRRRVRVPVKKERKKSGRKRKRDGSQSPRVAKQKRLQSKGPRRSHSTNRSDLHPTSCDGSSPGFESGSDQGYQADTNLTVELIPSTVTQETTRKTVPPKQKAPNRKGKFRDLLAQLHGNSSMIVKEKH